MFDSTFQLMSLKKKNRDMYHMVLRTISIFINLISIILLNLNSTKKINSTEDKFITSICNTDTKSKQKT